jgi:hypothetical protein
METRYLVWPAPDPGWPNAFSYMLPVLGGFSGVFTFSPAATLKPLASIIRGSGRESDGRSSFFLFEN